MIIEFHYSRGLSKLHQRFSLALPHQELNSGANLLPRDKRRVLSKDYA